MSEDVGIVPEDVAKEDSSLDKEVLGDEVDSLQAKIRQNFPFLTQVDRSRYNGASIDDPNGRILTFSADQDISPGSPSMQFLYLSKGFSISYRNMPEPSHPYTKRFADTPAFYGFDNKRWQVSEEDSAIEIAKLYSEGLDVETPGFKAKVAGWNMTEGRFVTFGERIDGEDLVVADLSTMIRRNPKLAAELVVSRIIPSQTYSFFGAELPAGQVIEEVRQGTELGKRILRRELNLLSAENGLAGRFPRDEVVHYVPEDPKTFEEMFPQAAEIKKPIKNSDTVAGMLGYMKNPDYSVRARTRAYEKTIDINGRAVLVEIEFNNTMRSDENITLKVMGTGYSLGGLEDVPEFRDMEYSAALPKGRSGLDKNALNNGDYLRVMVLLRAMEEKITQDLRAQSPGK